jgi:hypothetical protein
MRLFTVLEPPDGNADRVAFVPEGFSYAAFLLTVVWALWYRMWIVAALLFALTAALTVATNLELLGPGLAAVINFGIALLFGFEARALQVKSLEGVGFRRAGLIQASDGEAAELAYFEGRAPLATRSAPTSPPASHADTLGIFGNV